VCDLAGVTAKSAAAAAAGESVKQRFHSAVKEAFRFPDHYGHNLDALNDCLGDLDCDAAHPCTSHTTHKTHDTRHDTTNDTHGTHGTHAADGCCRGGRAKWCWPTSRPTSSPIPTPGGPSYSRSWTKYWYYTPHHSLMYTRPRP
jgi:hypothetical protein